MDTEEKQNMEMGTYQALIAGLRDVPSLSAIAFWGIGEPLFHPDIVEMVRKAKDLGVKTELITNGLLLDREMAEGLVLGGLDTLVVSVDGTTSETHKAIRPGADLHKVQENVAQEKITGIWDNREYKDFRRRVLKFDFSPCVI